MTATMTVNQREAMTAKLVGGKSPSEGMRTVGGPVQDHYVDAILRHLATPEFAALKPQADKITMLREDLVRAESLFFAARSLSR